MADITIPPEVLEAVAKVLHDHAEIFDDVPWEDLSGADQEAYMDEARAAILAALRAWPGMYTHEWHRPWLGGMSGTDIIPPLRERTDQRPRRTLDEMRGVFAEAYKSNRGPRDD